MGRWNYHRVESKRHLFCTSEQDPYLGSNSENSLLFYDSAYLLTYSHIMLGFWREPMSHGQACFHLTVGVSLFFVPCFHQKQDSELVGQAVYHFSRPVEGGEEKQQCPNLLKRWIHLGGYGTICKSQFLNLRTINILDQINTLLFEVALCTVRCWVAFWPLSTRCR